MNKIFKKLSFHVWNIGFLSLSEEDFLAHKSLGEIMWLKHSFKDRFFADPFFLSIDGNIAKVLVEELIFMEDKGRIVCLTCDTETGTLLDRKVVLNLPTHLAYPQPIREDEKVYLIPENRESGSLNVFLYDERTDTATFCQKLIDEPLADATLFPHNGKWWCFADHFLRNPNRDLFLYASDKLFGKYEMVLDGPVISDLRFGRCGGAIFSAGGKIFRPAQNCLNGYGSGLEVRGIVGLSAEKGLKEEHVASLSPIAPYGDALHTINFFKGKCVIDGYRLRFSPSQKIVARLRTRLAQKLRKIQ